MKKFFALLLSIMLLSTAARLKSKSVRLSMPHMARPASLC